MEIALLFFLILMCLIAVICGINDTIKEKRMRKEYYRYLVRRNMQLQRLNDFYRLQREIGEQDVQM